MTKIERQIIDAVRRGRWVISNHADERLDERGIESWQMIEGFDAGSTIAVELLAKPNPKILRRQMLPDGEEAVLVWAYDRNGRVAKLVTVYFEIE